MKLAQRADQPRAQRREAAGNPEPAILAPAGRSRMPSAAPSSQCGRGAKSNRGGSPQVRTTRLAAASPSGSLGRPGSSGTASAALVERGLDVAEPASSALTSSPEALSRAISSSAGSLARFRRATSSLAALRSALSASDPHQQLAPLAVELEQRVEQRAEGRVAAAEQAGAAPVGILAQTLEVDHGRSVVGRPGSRSLYPQLTLASTLKVTGAVLEAEDLELARTAARRGWCRRRASGRCSARRAATGTAESVDVAVAGRAGDVVEGLGRDAAGRDSAVVLGAARARRAAGRRAVRPSARRRCCRRTRSPPIWSVRIGPDADARTRWASAIGVPSRAPSVTVSTTFVSVGSARLLPSLQAAPAPQREEQQRGRRIVCMEGEG